MYVPDFFEPGEDFSYLLGQKPCSVLMEQVNMVDESLVCDDFVVIGQVYVDNSILWVLVFEHFIRDW
ncbi:14473_t:CDS:2 [Entrophospora sp. SA101]|nr:14473_t:CDS:2 [Entrophospora sp. SA101]